MTYLWQIECDLREGQNPHFRQQNIDVMCDQKLDYLCVPFLSNGSFGMLPLNMKENLQKDF
mgnify:CR=1 FL=1|jgi:hypothetical protein